MNSKFSPHAFLSRFDGFLRHKVSDYRYVQSTFSDANSRRNYRFLVSSLAPGFSGERAPLPLRVRALGGRPVYCRPATTDILVFNDTFRKLYHLPPSEMPRLESILDLGSNIGLTIDHYAELYPAAEILGVELDESNYNLCKKNISGYKSRCSVILGAVWSEDRAEMPYEGDKHWAFKVTGSKAAIKTTRCLSIDSLLDSRGWHSVDFMKVDVEGAEQELFSHATTWARRVKCLKVEVHSPYSIAECRKDLARLGYQTYVDTRHFQCVVAYSRSI